MGAGQVVLENAADALLQGYAQELGLYSRVRDIAAEQHQALRQRRDLSRFNTLLQRKQELLDTIGFLEAAMEKAKNIVMAEEPSRCPRRMQLAALLDRLMVLIQDIRGLERDNASLLEALPN